MTTPAALRELADRLDAWGRECEDLDDPHSNVPGVFLSDLVSGDFYDAMKEAAAQLRTAASEGGEHGHSAASIELSTREVLVPCDCGCGRQCCAMCGVDLGFIQEQSPPEVARDAGR